MQTPEGIPTINMTAPHAVAIDFLVFLMQGVQESNPTARTVRTPNLWLFPFVQIFVCGFTELQVLWNLRRLHQRTGDSQLTR